MKIRWKLLLILAGMTLLPLALLRFTAHHSSQTLIRDMTARMHETLVARAEEDLLRRLRDHVRIVDREGRIVSLGNARQAVVLHDILEGEPVPGRQRADWSGPTDQYCRLRQDAACEPISVDHSRLRLESGADAFAQQLSGIIPEFIDTYAENPELILWQLIRTEAGSAATWPAYEPPAPEATFEQWIAGRMQPMGMRRGHGMGHGVGRRAWKRGDIREGDAAIAPHQWYERIRESEAESLWIEPHADPVTRKVVVAKVHRVVDDAGRFVGATAAVVPMRSILQGGLAASPMTRNMASLLVETVDTEDGLGLRILAEEGTRASGRRRGSWMAHMTPQGAVDFPDPHAEKHMATELAEGNSGTIRMDFEGADSLWVFAPFRARRSGLVLVVPMQDVAGDASRIETFVRQRIDRQYTLNGYAIGLMALAALVAAMVLSRALTGPITGLARAFRRVADGDFDVRVPVAGRDELAQLSRTFNDMVPNLRDQVLMRESLEVARQIQTNLLPSAPPAVPGLDVAGTSIYCDETGGDYFDYPPLGPDDGRLGVAVGDVSGHGIQAALLMTTGRALLRQRAAMGGTLGEIVIDANQLLASDLSMTGRFITLWLCAFDADAGTVHYVRAGHDPALCYDPGGDRIFELDGAGSLPLGVAHGQRYQERRAELPPGSVVLMGTDGIWEAEGPDGERFGKERLAEILRRRRASAAQEILAAILHDLEAFVGSAGFKDDVTLVVVRHTGVSM